MPIEKKIFLDKNEDLAAVVSRLIEAKSQIVFLNIPRDSVLSQSVDNFHVLKRESATAGKELNIESVDDTALELAALAGIGAVNPLWRKRERVISDILPKPKIKRAVPEEISLALPETKVIPAAIPPAKAEKVWRKNKKRRVPRMIYSLAALVLILGGGLVLATRVLPKATVEMILKKVPVTFAYEVEAGSASETSRALGTKLVLPAELLRAAGNLSLNFPASGREKVERKAKGVITVYNAYSSEAQILVPTTRFLTPSGKLFRLDERVTIPGAKVESGKIIPSRIDVRVTADEAGEEYNIGPEERWRIPGFRGDPRYEGFYANSSGAMSGGFVGEEATPTKEDIEQGKAKLLTELEDVLGAQVLILLSDKFKVFPAAREFKLLKEQIETAGGASSGDFSIFAEGELRYLVFEEKMLEEAITSALGKTVPADMKVKEFSVSYGEPKVDLAEGSMSFSAEGKMVFEPNLDVEGLKREFAGQNEAELRKSVFFLSGLEQAKIKLWPFWVNRVPENPDKVKIILN